MTFGPYRRGDSFRSWFRGRWMGSNEESTLTAHELSAAPLTGARILEFPIRRFPATAPYSAFIERHAPAVSLWRQWDGQDADAKVATGLRIQSPGALLCAAIPLLSDG